MSISKSKKRKHITCDDFKKLNKKAKKAANIHTPSSTPSNIPTDHSVVVIDYSPSIVSLVIDQIVSSNTLPSSSSYTKTPSSKGLDLSTFRVPFIKAFDPYSNLCNAITRSASSSFQCFPQYNNSKNTNFLDTHFCTDSETFPIELLNKNRCIVEDFIQLPAGSEVALLVPLFSNKVNHILRNVNIISDKHNVQFGTDRSKKYLLFSGYVKSNNKYEEFDRDNISRIDVMNAFRVGRDNGYGLILSVRQVLFGMKKDSMITSSHCGDVLIKWIDVLVGCKDGIQVWSHITSLRDFSKNLSYNPNDEKSLDALNYICGYIFEEIYMDKIYMIHLLTKYYMVINQRNKIFIESLKKNQKLEISMDLSSSNFKLLNVHIDKCFEDAMLKCYTDFCEITQPLVSRDCILHLVAMYKQHLPVHYNCLMSMFGFDKRSKLKKNAHLVKGGFYDRLVFFQYLTQNRVSCNHSFTYWGMVTTASAYSRGNQASLTNSFFGNSTSLGTFLRNTKEWRENMDNSIHLRLRNEDNIVCCIDNNQKGHNLKYQRFGVSNKYVKVTGCIIKKYHYIFDRSDYPTSKVDITYSSQAIPSPFGMPSFENCSLTDDKIFEYFHSCFERNQDLSPQLTTNADVDFTGKRVQSYASIVNCLETVQLMKQVIGSTYNKSTDTLKFVEFSPENWQSPTIGHIIKYLSPLKRSILFMKCNNFQNEIVAKWNPNYQTVSQFIVPKVFLHDEITTDGYGKCIIELLTMHGILIKTPINDNLFEWVLAENWNSKTIILCLDGLSLDRHRCFGNKLINLPMSFTRAYKQSLIFKDALSRIIEVSGPLHTAFHMMQSIFNVYRCILKTMQDCIGWKKMKLNHVSENYRQCNSLMNMVYEEIFRILFFTYLTTLKDNQVLLLTNNTSSSRETWKPWILFNLGRRHNLVIESISLRFRGILLLVLGLKSIVKENYMSLLPTLTNLSIILRTSRSLDSDGTFKK